LKALAVGGRVRSGAWPPCASTRADQAIFRTTLPRMCLDITMARVSDAISNTNVLLDLDLQAVFVEEASMDPAILAVTRLHVVRATTMSYKLFSGHPIAADLPVA
jgi:hypothetical protein